MGATVCDAVSLGPQHHHAHLRRRAAGRVFLSRTSSVERLAVPPRPQGPPFLPGSPSAHVMTHVSTTDVSCPAHHRLPPTPCRVGRLPDTLLCPFLLLRFHQQRYNKYQMSDGAGLLKKKRERRENLKEHCHKQVCLQKPPRGGWLVPFVPDRPFC